MQITNTGNYQTRNGRTVQISEVNVSSVFTYPVKGHVLVPNKTGSRIKRNWTIWKLNGRHIGDVVDNPWDIVKSLD